MNTDPGMATLAWADQWIAHLRAHGVESVCIAPGSRSTALAVAAARCPGLNTHVHFDERGLGFFALGLARATRTPVAVVTTSGTAVANLLPAVIEAWHDRVPLIFLTADRPPELRDNAANQSIDQAGIFGRHVRWFFDVPCPSPAIPSSFVASTAAHAISSARQGPVHLNLQFREPFLPNDPPPFPPATLVRRVVESVAALPSDESRALADRISGEPAGVIVAGQMEDEDDQRAVARLAHALGWPVAADLASGMNRVGACGAAGSHDLLFIDPARIPMAGLCLHLGGRLVSKRLAKWMSTRVREIIRVAPDDSRLDPDLSVHTRIRVGVESFVSGILPLLTPVEVDPEFSTTFEAFERRVGDLLAPLWDPAPGAALTEIDAVRVARGLLGGEADVFVGNSLPVRIFDSLHGCVPSPHTRWFCNRGASGIDGNIATLAGIAVTAPAGRRVLGFVGDLTALHDLNSLVLLARSPVPVVLFVLNNDGGGIFSHLPVRSQSALLDRFFTTPHGLKFEGAARMAGLNYLAVATAGELDRAAEAVAGARRSTLVEMTVDREHSRQVWTALLERMGKGA